MKTLEHNPSMGVAYSSLWAPDWIDFYSPTYKTNWFSWERFYTWPPFEGKGFWNLEMAYFKQCHLYYDMPKNTTNCRYQIYKF